MVVLTAEEIKQWFSAVPNVGSEYVRYDRQDPYFSHPEANCIDIEFPAKAERLPFFARCLATIGYKEEDFRGALLWFADWGVWNALDQGIGYRIIEAMHKAVGQPRSFEAGLGHHFRADELQDAIAMLLQPMIFGWDANYVPSWSFGESSQFFLHVSHDSFVSLATRTKEFHEKVFGLLKEADLDPKPGHELQVRRFCRVP